MSNVSPLSTPRALLVCLGPPSTRHKRPSSALACLACFPRRKDPDAPTSLPRTSWTSRWRALTAEPALQVAELARRIQQRFDITVQRVASLVLFFTLNREDFSFVIHLDRQPRTSRRREAQTGSRARSGSRSERTLDAVEHSRTLMEWWPFLIFHRGGLRIKVINNTLSRTFPQSGTTRTLPSVNASECSVCSSKMSP